MKPIGPDHPIVVAPFAGRVVIRLGGIVVADSTRALALDEKNYPRVYYLPRDDVRMDILVRTAHRTTCPYKGEAGYFSIRGADGEVANAVWSYETPFDQVREIAGRLAFYANKVVIEATPS